MGAALSTPEKSIHEFTIKDCKNKDVDLSKYKGKVILIVNVAIHCSFASPHYTQLANLYTKYKDKGFEIFAFPCNQFLRQAPGPGQKSEEIVCERFKAEYPVFQKVRVNGPETAPIYKFLKASKPGILGSGIKWNFTKFLIDKEGRVIKRYPTAIFPAFIEEDIKKALGEM